MSRKQIEKKIEFQNVLMTCDVSNRSYILDMILPVDHMDHLWTEHVRFGGRGVCVLMTSDHGPDHFSLLSSRHSDHLLLPH